MVTVDVDGSSLLADSRPKLVGLVLTRIHQMTCVAVRSTVTLIITMSCYASAVYAVDMCLSVRLPSVTCL